MADLRNLESDPGPGIVTYPGVIVPPVPGSKLMSVNVNGNILPARWADPLVVAVGDPVLVDIRIGPGQGEAFVRCRLTTAPRPSEGTVKTVPPSSVTITVTGTDGADYTAKFLSSYTPAVNDNVILSWNAATPTVQGKVGTVAAPLATVAIAPTAPATRTGSTPYAASDAATWVPSLGVWDRWAGGGGNVYQGSNGGYTTYGAWFYAGSPSELSGRTITRVQFTLGSRRSVGSYNSPVTVHFFAHTNVSRPGGDVTRTTGPYDVTIQPGSGQTTFDLPTTFGAALQAGGGIAISGEPYAGFNGRNIEPASGLLTIDWSR